MIRDPLKDKAYFGQYIKDENETIEAFKELLDIVISQRGLDDEGVRDGFKSLNFFHFNKLNAMYSGGTDLREIRDFIPVVIDWMEKGWTGGHYIQMLWILSISFMLEIDDDQFERIVKLVRRYRMEDVLIDFLLTSRNSAPQKSDSPLLHEDPYRKLIDLIHLNDPEQQSQKLKEYLELHWYDGHKDTGWYDSHTNPDAIYSGYWSFESGAIVKILGLDDSSLKNVPYYPYDMVHFKK
ncbi:hypothetical protein AV656_08540 [Bhargavaea cecembensis]|uniref:PoNi C-terminal domain-containing protein n=1 Tax=Bhargavaea cecembensis TaxID=394098 RepID=A0A163FMJ0_9BACL|nr:PoNi-like cognate immunity protein [Bhargavaea cecembensis]KZE38937.1 hypothetical protein AV656_08540 [Bhargavaea cecembensis]